MYREGNIHVNYMIFGNLIAINEGKGLKRQYKKGTLYINCYFSTIFDISIDDLTLSPGTVYRVVLRLCARTICFQSIHTDGVMVIAKPPTTGGINVEHRNITEGGGTEKVCII
jgi:hypothetical protein